MNLRVGSKIGFSRQVDFLVMGVSWFLCGLLLDTAGTSPSIFVSWVLLTTILSMVSLGAIGYFNHYIPKPELTGVMSLLLVLPASACLAKWVVVVITSTPTIRYIEAIQASVMVALLFEVCQLVVFGIHRAMGRKWSLVTYLHPEELDTLRTQIEDSGSSWWINVHPYRMVERNGSSRRTHETLVISRRAVRNLKNHPELLTAHLRGQRIVDVGQLLKEFRGRVSLDKVDGWSFLLASTYQSFPIRVYFYVKEFLEVFLAIILVLLLAPLWASLAVAVYLKHGRPILYKQERLGYRGRKFFLYKFRTMPISAEKTGPQWASEDDPRATGLGRWLRRTRLDELPQLLNVIQGELSFVGPRPERPEFYEMLNEHIPLFSLRLLVRPGITGWAQVRQGYAGSIEECKTKLEYDFYYVQNMSPRFDVNVLVSTAALMLRGNGGR